jgi:hypothetical protein
MPEQSGVGAFDKWKKSMQYVQFSKRVIKWVSLGVFALSVYGMTLCYVANYPQGIVSIAQSDIWYGMFAFIAYSGNSALEKWLIKKGGGLLGGELNHVVKANESEQDEQEDSVG